MGIRRPQPVEDAAMARVPAGTTVEATLTMLAPLAARDDTYWIGNPGNPSIASTTSSTVISAGGRASR